MQVVTAAGRRKPKASSILHERSMTWVAQRSPIVIAVPSLHIRQPLSDDQFASFQAGRDFDVFCVREPNRHRATLRDVARCGEDGGAGLWIANDGMAGTSTTFERCSASISNGDLRPWRGLGWRIEGQRDRNRLRTGFRIGPAGDAQQLRRARALRRRCGPTRRSRRGAHRRAATVAVTCTCFGSRSVRIESRRSPRRCRQDYAAAWR